MRQLMKHDIQYGIKNQWKIYLAGCMLVLFACRHCQDGILYSYRYGLIKSRTGTVMDYLMEIFKGMTEYNLTESSVFRIPTMWVSVYIILAYLVGYYAEKDLKTYGMYSLLAVKSRTKWWISKCIWCIGSVTIFYMLAWITTVFYVKRTGGDISLYFTPEIALLCNTGTVYLKNDYRVIIIVMVLPLLMSCALSLLQMLCSLFVGSVTSFASICCLYIVSLYYNTSLSPVNYLMWMRTDMVMTKNGWNALVGILLALIISVFSMLVGIIYIEKCDMLSKQL